MTTLALEFSSDRRSVAIWHADRMAEVVHEGTRETPIFRMIADVLAQAGLGREAVECVAVGLGPGSYTGVRLAISVAQGWQLASGVKTVGVSSLETLRASARAAGFQGAVTLAVYAQRDEFAVQLMGDTGWLGPVKLISREQLSRLIAAGGLVVGPDVVGRLPGEVFPLFPRAQDAARLAQTLEPVPAEALVPVYLREAAFVKAPPARSLAELGLSPEGAA